MNNRVIAIVCVFLFLAAGALLLKKAGRKAPGGIVAGKTASSVKSGKKVKASRYGSQTSASAQTAPGQEGPRGRWAGVKPSIPRSLQYEKAMDLLDSQNYKEASAILRDLKGEYPEQSYEGMLLAYNEAESYFFSKSMNMARSAYQDFLSKYPDSPFTENAREALSFIDNFDKYKKMYVSPDDIK
ncbi:MAG: hypothetical protein CVV64_03705 [Candidatus Wallbacteria bacterium HGW-Wallbacteria-1]|jgi:TolA-binding protein|uniref:Outer membrane lipoprotein BamD-like domain-containing protein n=1 Tax=Candidatus Wallbacteria bacterium HGW-Wallbacteria-1 TaxID=2013854 RepID=A0A2N1PTV9_9BACT|nr:MAG: hypothetical protein CVV64_03705 [Candidatus Wallbacteria bacterium HGW-Wallbacteria-1]